MHTRRADALRIGSVSRGSFNPLVRSRRMNKVKSRLIERDGQNFEIAAYIGPAGYVFRVLQRGRPTTRCTFGASFVVAHDFQSYTGRSVIDELVKLAESHLN